MQLLHKNALDIHYKHEDQVAN